MFFDVLFERNAKNAKYGFTGRFVEIEFYGEMINVYYIEKGSHDLPVMLLLHGLGGTASNWYFNGELASNYHLIAVDLPGFGLTDLPQDDRHANLDGAVTFIDHFLASLGICELAALAGNSAGGLIAIDYAVKGRAKPERLILAAPGGIGREVSMANLVLGLIPGWLIASRWWDKIIAHQIDKRRHKSPDALLADNSLMPSREDAFDIPDTHDSLWAAGIKRLLHYAVGLFGQRKEVVSLINTELANVDCPVLVVWGTRDKTIPVKQVFQISEIAPGSKAVLFTQCGHVPQVEKYELFNEVVAAFLADPETFGDNYRTPHVFGYIIQRP